MPESIRLLAVPDTDTSEPVVSFELPLYLRGSQNAREHWSTRSRRVRRERGSAALLCRAGCLGVRLPCVVTITRYGSVLIRDLDNLISVCKGVRDGIADALGVDDSDPRIEWRYAQARSRRGQERVGVTIR